MSYFLVYLFIPIYIIFIANVYIFTCLILLYICVTTWLKYCVFYATYKVQNVFPLYELDNKVIIVIIYTTGCLVKFPVATNLIIVNNCLQISSINFNIIVVFNKVTDCGALESRDLRLFSKHILKSCLPRFILRHTTLWMSFLFKVSAIPDIKNKRLTQIQLVWNKHSHRHSKLWQSTPATTCQLVQLLASILSLLYHFYST